jgi:hypothetical protein
MEKNAARLEPQYAAMVPSIVELTGKIYHEAKVHEKTNVLQVARYVVNGYRFLSGDPQRGLLIKVVCQQFPRNRRHKTKEATGR